MKEGATVSGGWLPEAGLHPSPLVLQGMAPEVEGSESGLWGDRGRAPFLPRASPASEATLPHVDLFLCLQLLPRVTGAPYLLLRALTWQAEVSQLSQHPGLLDLLCFLLGKVKPRAGVWPRSHTKGGQNFPKPCFTISSKTLCTPAMKDGKKPKW